MQTSPTCRDTNSCSHSLGKQHVEAWPDLETVKLATAFNKIITPLWSLQLSAVIFKKLLFLFKSKPVTFKLTMGGVATLTGKMILE